MAKEQKEKAGRAVLRKYGFLVFAVALALAGWLIDSAKAEQGLVLAGEGIAEMLGFLPPVFVLLGLFDVWVDRETVIRLMGRESGAKGALRHTAAFSPKKRHSRGSVTSPTIIREVMSMVIWA